MSTKEATARIVFLRSNPIKPDPRVEKEANSLLKAGHKVMAVAWNRELRDHPKFGYIHLENGQMPIRWFNQKAAFGGGMRNLLPLVFFQVMLLCWLCKHIRKYDCIHACDFDTVLPAWIISKLFRKRLVYDVFDYYVEAFTVPKMLSSLIEAIDIFIMNTVDTVIITNESRLQQIKKSKPKHVVIIHNSPKQPNFSINEKKLKRIKPIFTYVGILQPGRLLLEILEVFKKKTEWELHIGGFGILEKTIEEAARQYDNIHFYGRIPYHSVLELEAKSDILFAVYDPCVPNHKYSSPNKLYEAMMLGKPIIVSKGTGIDQIVDEQNIGLSIHYNGEEFEAAATSLLKMNDLKKLKERSTAIYHTHYSWELMEQRLTDLYGNFKKTS